MAVTDRATLLRIKQMITKRPDLMGTCPWSTDREIFSWSQGPFDYAVLDSDRCRSCQKVMKVADHECPCLSNKYFGLPKARIMEICRRIISEAGL